MAPSPVIPNLRAAAEHSHARALAALDRQGAASLAAVTWTSVHLAAAERVLYPAVLRHVPHARHRVRTQLDADRRLHQALWQLDRQVTGAQAQVRTSAELLVADVRSALAEHAAGEQALLDELHDVTDAAQQDGLAARLAAVSAHAPTRPHPDTFHGRLLGSVSFTVEAWADRVRDAFDGRSVPTPHRLRPTPAVGKWGSYLTAAPRHAEPTDGTDGRPEAEPPAG